MLDSRYVIIVLLCWSFVTNEAIIRDEDICGIQNGRRLYLELGEQGVLYAKNVSFIKNAPRLQDSRIYATNSSHDQCSLELVTCPSCVITLTFKSIALSQNCGDGSFMMDSSCRCDYVWISEPPYEDVSGTPFCGFYSPISYRSNTRTLSINLLYSQSHNHAFTLEYTSERNRIHLQGSEISSEIGKSRNSTMGGILTSPFFPSRYPRDLGMEYVITCPTEAPSCRVRVLFSDFQLAAVSIIEFYDWNGQRLDVSSGVRFRPPVIVSSGPSLLIRFYANGGTGLGYKAFYSFVLGHLYDKSVQPITDCGGYVENLGGAITMMDMVEEGVKIYDCVWLIRPPKTFLHMKTHIYLKIITFDDMAGSTELIIKQGPTSALLPLEILRHPASKLQPRKLKEHIAPISSGFHVSLRGTFGPTSHLAVAYTTFSYTDCFTGSDFLCQNHRCIPSQLNCDGFDHCGDNSDEPSTCVGDWDLAPQDRKWHTNKANYYFPKIDHYPDLKTATFVFVASSLGLITLISALIVLLYRMGARARQQREFHSRLQTISELLDGARIEEVNVTDDPPGYESPPGYDEVVKLSLECESKKKKKRKINSSCRLSSNSNNHCSAENEANSSVSIPIDGGASTSDNHNYVSNNDSNVVPVPESPPPPYITPPGTITRAINFIGLSETRECAADDFSDHEDAQTWQPPIEENQSLPESEAATPECLTSSTDAELLGAYHQNCDENSTESSTSQLSSWRGALMTINPESERRSNDAEVVRDVPEDNTIKNCSCRRVCSCGFNDTGNAPSSSTPEVASKKTAKPRTKKKTKNQVLTSNSSVATTSLDVLPITSTVSNSAENTMSSNFAPTSSNFTATASNFISCPVSYNASSNNVSSNPKTISSNHTANTNPSNNTALSIASLNNSATVISSSFAATSSSSDYIANHNVPVTRAVTNLPTKIFPVTTSIVNDPPKVISPSILKLTNPPTLKITSSIQAYLNSVAEASSAFSVIIPKPSAIKNSQIPGVISSLTHAVSSTREKILPTYPVNVSSTSAISSEKLSSPVAPIHRAVSPLIKHLAKSSHSQITCFTSDAISSNIKASSEASFSTSEAGSSTLKASSSGLKKIPPAAGESHQKTSTSTSSIKSSEIVPSSSKAAKPVKSLSTSSLSTSSTSIAMKKSSSNSSIKTSSNSVGKTSSCSAEKDSSSSLRESSSDSIEKVSRGSGRKTSSGSARKASSGSAGKASLNSAETAPVEKASSSSTKKIPPNSKGSTLSNSAKKTLSSTVGKASSVSGVNKPRKYSTRKSTSTSRVKASPANSRKTSPIPPSTSFLVGSSSVTSSSTSPSISSSTFSSSSISSTPSLSKVNSSPAISVIPLDASSVILPELSIIETNTKNPTLRKMCFNSANCSPVSCSPSSTTDKFFVKNNLSRKFSDCSHDSYVTKFTALSTSSSFEKLHDDIEIMSQYSSTFDLNSQNNTPFNTPKADKEKMLSLARCNPGQSNNCDLESLYKGSKALDSFIAKHDKNINCTKSTLSDTTVLERPKHISRTGRKNLNQIEKKFDDDL